MTETRIPSTKYFKKIFKRLRPSKNTPASSQDAFVEDHSESGQTKLGGSYGGESYDPPYPGTSYNDSNSTESNPEINPSSVVSKLDDKDVYASPRKRESLLGETVERKVWDVIENEKVSDPLQKRDADYEHDNASHNGKDDLNKTEISDEGFRPKRRISLIRLGERTSTNKGNAVPRDDARNINNSRERKRRTSLFGEEMDDAVWQMFDSNDFGSRDMFGDKTERSKRSLSLFSSLETDSLAERQRGTGHNEREASEGGTIPKRRMTLFRVGEKHTRKQENDTTETSMFSEGVTKRKRRISLFRLGEKHTRKQENEANDTRDTSNAQCNVAGKKTFKEEIQQALLELLQDGSMSDCSDGSFNRDDEDNISLSNRSESHNNDINHQMDSSLGSSTGSYFQSLDETFTQLDLEANEVIKSIRDEFSDENMKNIMASSEKVKNDDEDDGMEDEISKLISISIALRDEIEEAEAPMSELGISESLTESIR